MILDWKSLLQQIVKRGGELGELTPGTRSGYRMLHAAGAETNHLDAKTRELIALAISVTTRCDGCIANHTQKAIQLGISREEIAEALGVAVAMNAGAALAYSGRVMDAYAALGGADGKSN
jgi:AhpD family alkylhydroperoxidase